jgi:hypothetical protein
MRRIYRADRIGANTAIFGVVGATTESDRLFQVNEALRARRLDAVAVPIADTPSIESVVREYSSLPVDGWFLTTPVPVGLLEPVVRRFGTMAQQTGMATAIARRNRDLLAADVGQTVERVIEFWLDGLPAVGGPSRLTSTRRD